MQEEDYWRSDRDHIYLLLPSAAVVANSATTEFRLNSPSENNVYMTLNNRFVPLKRLCHLLGAARLWYHRFAHLSESFRNQARRKEPQYEHD